MKAIVNTTVILEDALIYDGVVLFDEKGILAAGEADSVSLPEGTQVIDGEGLYTAPGFVDIHSHGGYEAFHYDDPERAAQMFLDTGTTTILAGLYMTLTYDELTSAMDKIRAARRGKGAGRIIEGIYMEGPYLNGKYGAEAYNNKWNGPIDMEVARKLADYGGTDVKVWCFGPEREGIEEFARYAHQVNPDAALSIAHSECKPWMAYRLKKYGLRSQTHHTNATGVVNPICPNNTGGIKDVGPDEAALYDPDIYTELICDSQGIHVKPFMLKMVARIKGIERIILITDYFPCNNEPPKEVMGGKPAPDIGYDAQGGVCGSLMTMDTACRNMMKHTGYGLCHVVKFASINPARMLRIDDRVGSIEPGKRANLIIIDDKVNIKKVILDGEVVR